jgi:DNA processing protein
LQVAEEARTVDRLTAMTVEELRRLVGRKAADELSARPLEVRPMDLPEDVWTVGYWDAGYPTGLRAIADPPAVLWGRGQLPVGLGVAVVGSRDATDWSKRTARLVAEAAVGEGFVVISGLAVGVDAAAHEACVDAGGVTVAILGNAVDKPYPAKNRRLADRIVEGGGCVIAEVPPGTTVARHALVTRDRLQSAMSLATVVVQTGIPGGTLHTVRFTVEQGRVLVVALPTSRRISAGEPGPYSGNVALTDPQGCDPSLLGARGRTARLIADRKPVADLVLRSKADLPELWDRLRWERPDRAGR